MCCQDEAALGLPAPVIEALAHDRRRAAAQGWDWGDEGLPEMFRWARFGRLGDVMGALGEDGDWARAVRSVVGEGPVPSGLAVVTVTDDGVAVDAGPPRPSTAGVPVALDVVLDAAATTRETTVAIAGGPVVLAPGAATIHVADLDGDDPRLVVGHGPHVGERLVATPRPPATLRLTASTTVRWSVTDAGGGAWFPEGVPHKWDVHDRPFFHARASTVTVPAAALHVVATRGLEYAPVTAEVHPAPGATAAVALDPVRVVDPAAEGWFGADLHAHLNYSGDHVLAPDAAHRMQDGEGLHLLTLTAGNLFGARVYDRELLETTAGEDLWAHDGHVARAGVEFRNDLLGHVHALGVTSPPARYSTGHPGTPHPHDHPPNAVACADLRERGGAVVYAHPSATALADGTPDALYTPARTVEARALVADAALGLVDGVDLISPFDDEGAAVLFHRLLSCGLRPAATAGTDVFLSFAHGPGVASNPPGWGRVYADLGGASLSAAGVRAAVAAGRTTVTNGPFLILTVDGRGPGSVLDASPGDRLAVVARARGTGAASLSLVGPDGVIAEGPAGTGDDVLRAEVVVEGPLWVAAIARGPAHPAVLDARAFAHTSAVHVEVDGARPARAAAARWCLDALDRLEALVADQGRFDPAERAEHLADHREVLDRARAVYRAVAAAAPR